MLKRYILNDAESKTLLEMETNCIKTGVDKMDDKEQIDWTCKECDFGWIGDYTDFSCPACDEIDIKPKNKLLD